MEFYGYAMKPTRRRVQSPFARNLAKLLKERSLSQRAAAEIAGVSVSVINSWLSNSVPQDHAALLRLCKALNADFQHLLTGEFSTLSPKDLKLEDVFDVENSPQFSGVFLLEAKRLKRKGGSE